VLEKEPMTRFVVAGAGPESDRVRRLADELGVAERFLFAGHLRAEDVTRLYEAASLFVMPSISEPFGLAGIEAMSHGVPTIVGRGAGMTERVESAVQADFWSEDDLAAKMLTILGDDALARSLGERGAMEVQQMKWEDAATAVAEVYASLL
jgi:glycosyltransferase involved in cell wall biosynthesis